MSAVSLLRKIADQSLFSFSKRRSGKECVSTILIALASISEVSLSFFMFCLRRDDYLVRLSCSEYKFSIHFPAFGARIPSGGLNLLIADLTFSVKGEFSFCFSFEPWRPR